MSHFHFGFAPVEVTQFKFWVYVPVKPGKFPDSFSLVNRVCVRVCPG